MDGGVAVLDEGEVFEQPALVADTTPVALSRAAAAGLHPDVKAVLATVGAEGTRSDIHPPVPARQPHGLKPWVQLLGVGHGTILPPLLLRGNGNARPVNPWLGDQA